jgi:DNA polymerase III alpha subunit (gram-positive type)
MNKDVVMIFDLETTSNDKNIADIVQFGAVLMEEDGTALPVMQTYVMPDRECSEEALKVHGIGKDKYWLSPSQGQVLRQFKLLIDDYQRQGNRVFLGGFNSSRYDVPIADRIMPEAGFTEMGQLDVVCFAQRVYPLLENHKLGTVNKHLFPDEASEQFRRLAHDAIADCYLVAQIISYIKEQYGVSLADLQTWCATPQVLSVCHFGKHRGKEWKEVPKTYITWIRNTWADISEDMKATLESLGV